MENVRRILLLSEEKPLPRSPLPINKRGFEDALQVFGYDHLHFWGRWGRFTFYIITTYFSLLNWVQMTVCPIMTKGSGGRLYKEASVDKVAAHNKA